MVAFVWLARGLTSPSPDSGWRYDLSLVLFSCNGPTLSVSRNSVALNELLRTWTRIIIVMIIIIVVAVIVIRRDEHVPATLFVSRVVLTYMYVVCDCVSLPTVSGSSAINNGPRIALASALVVSLSNSLTVMRFACR